MKQKLIVMLSFFFIIAFFSGESSLASKSIVTHQAVIRDWKHMSKPCSKNPKLMCFINTLYRPNATIGSGSTADAVRYELATSQPLNGKFHFQKGRDSITFLYTWIKENPKAHSEDVVVARRLILDLEDALNPQETLQETLQETPLSRNTTNWNCVIL